MRSDQAFWALAGYLPWGLFQQYVLNGYFLNRFDSALSRRSAPMISAALFSGAHLPNWFLMAVTLLAGYASVRIYRRYNNLYSLGLGLAHGTVGFLLLLVVPDSISHHLTVGPGWFGRSGKPRATNVTGCPTSEHSKFTPTIRPAATS